MTNLRKNYLLYDGDCPICHSYVLHSRLNQSLGELQLVSARKDSEILREVTENGWNIDKGMVLKLDQTLYYGKEAIKMLALLSTRSDFFNKAMFWLFRSSILSSMLYPVCIFGRTVLLYVLRIKKIKNLEK